MILLRHPGVHHEGKKAVISVVFHDSVEKHPQVFHGLRKRGLIVGNFRVVEQIQGFLAPDTAERDLEDLGDRIRKSGTGIQLKPAGCCR